VAPGAPKWRTKDLETGHVSTWDGEWFYHFRDGGYATIEWVEIRASTDEQVSAVQSEFARIHVPVKRTDCVFKVYGFIVPGESIAYASL